MKTWKAYGYHEESGRLIDLGDVVKASKEANMTVVEFKKKLVELNPQLEIRFVIEDVEEPPVKELSIEDILEELR